MKPDADLTNFKRVALRLQRAEQALRKWRGKPPLSNAKRAPAPSTGSASHGGRAAWWLAAAGCLGLSASTMQPLEVHGEVNVAGCLFLIGRAPLAANPAPTVCALHHRHGGCGCGWAHCYAQPRPSIRPSPRCQSPAGQAGLPTGRNAKPGRPASTRRGSSR